MQPESQVSPWRRGLRTGGGLLVTAAILFPIVTIVGRLMPSRENTTLDELPADLMMLVVVGLAAAGVLRVGYALMVERRRERLAENDRQRLAPPPAAERIQALKRERFEVRDK